jgi:hypothetical protein
MLAAALSMTKWSSSVAAHMADTAAAAAEIATADECGILDMTVVHTVPLACDDRS